MSDARRKLISFDCYGTLIRFDLDGAVRSIVGPRAAEYGIDLQGLLADLRVIRFFATSSLYRRYQDILRDTLEIACMRHGIPYDERFGDELIEAVRRFEPFGDVHAGLTRLQEMGYQLALLTNSDNDLIPHHVKTLGIDFDHVFTAEDARAYKPRKQAFEYMFRIVDRPRELLTHAAQGWEYDIIPTAGMGVRRVWINRSRLPGNPRFAPYHEVADTHGLADLMAETDRG
ncbi:haloacid dehalogenase type II [Leucobacter sp. wl10]|uniref:haloacid dehalogenase type II n=1 Tax=Leucobacter sp. wl10 TaxID=2304677 RepID=UPI000E5C304E|nr:haloacid dehalogenase type II [Leucobacter sp. wl10]RGE22047.1 haloacid dehalogenase type II [Leucobacter sp. wl10]